jgi:cytochrome c biogenesis protein CcmG/thiol:disulfide interchange protein DsbE
MLDMRMRMKDALVPAFVLCGLAALALETGASASGSQRRLFPDARDVKERAESQLVGRMAPNLQATEWIGAPVDLRHFRGKVVIVDFWASWCGSCRQQMSTFRKWREKYGDQVVMVGVTNLDGQTIDKIQEFVRKHKAPDFVAIDHENLTHRAYQVRAIPQSFVIDREGVVQFASVGAEEDARLEQEIDRAIGAGNTTH